MRAEAELDAAAGRQRLDPLQHRIDMRFAEPIGMEPLEEDRGLPAAPRQEPRDHLLVEHAVQLARHAGGEEEARLADVEREAAGRADRIVEHFRGRGQHRLLAVVGRHDAAAAREQRLHLGEPFLAEDELDPRRLGRDLLRQIIDRGPEPAIDHDRVRPLPGEAEGGEKRVAVVADDGAPAHREPDILELLGDRVVVGVDDLAAQDLVAGADDLELHAQIRWPSPSGMSRKVLGANSSSSVTRRP